MTQNDDAGAAIQYMIHVIAKERKGDDSMCSVCCGSLSFLFILRFYWFDFSHSYFCRHAIHSCHRIPSIALLIFKYAISRQRQNAAECPSQWMCVRVALTANNKIINKNYFQQKSTELVNINHGSCSIYMRKRISCPTFDPVDPCLSFDSEKLQ